MRRSHLFVVALLVLGACGHSKAKSAGGSVAAPSSTSPSALTSTVSAGPSSGTTVAASTSTSASTSTTVLAPIIPAPTTPPVTVNELPRCETSSTTTGGLCLLTTVPVRADADQIIAAYLTFAKKHIEVQSNPDNPDWAGLQALVVPEIRDEARTEIEVRFKRGETLNTTAGVTFNPKVSRLSYPDDFIKLTDCRLDGTFWADRASGQPVTGQLTDVHKRTFRADLRRSGGVWQLSYYQYVAEACDG